MDKQIGLTDEGARKENLAEFVPGASWVPLCRAEIAKRPTNVVHVRVSTYPENETVPLTQNFFFCI